VGLHIKKHSQANGRKDRQYQNPIKTSLKHVRFLSKTKQTRKQIAIHTGAI
jgi:hypothetical protein